MIGRGSLMLPTVRFIRRTTPLPTLSAPKGKKGPAGRSQLKNVTVHDGGVVVAVRDIPEEVLSLGIP